MIAAIAPGCDPPSSRNRNLFRGRRSRLRWATPHPVSWVYGTPVSTSGLDMVLNSACLAEPKEARENATKNKGQPLTILPTPAHCERLRLFTTVYSDTYVQATYDSLHIKLRLSQEIRSTIHCDILRHEVVVEYSKMCVVIEKGADMYDS